MIQFETIKHFEDGRVVGEFNDLQAYTDFLIERTKRKCDADYILSQRLRNKEMRIKWKTIGFIIGCVYSILLEIIFKYFL